IASTPIETQKPLVKDEEAGLWYPRVSSFNLESYSDSDYARANLDRKSTTGGCQFLGRRLIFWQCKKHTIVATSTIEAEYVAAASCYSTTIMQALLTVPTSGQYTFKSKKIAQVVRA
ncbi:hypothetical protein Tco_0051053, partial [Tanacetum coccineum]